MTEGIFDGIFTHTEVAMSEFLLCLAVSLVTGVFLALMYIIKSRWTKSFVITLCVLPAVVCVVIMTVNGNVGAGVAVAGAFSLVRFRSVPGSARDIGTLFLAMGTGLMCGMGYLGYGVLFAVITGVFLMLLTVFAGTKGKKTTAERTLRVTVPEDLDYTGMFDDLMEKYTVFNEVATVKTVNMGSLFRVTYDITLKKGANEKEFIDEIRCRNGNLEISMGRREVNVNEL